MNPETEAYPADYPERDYETFVTGFVHQNRQFTVWMATDASIRMVGPERLVHFGIIDDAHQKHGEIYGSLSGPDEKEFRSETLVNYGLYKGFRQHIVKKPWHVDGVIRETIAQLLIRGVLQTWTSSDNLLSGGEITYEALLSDDRLTGTKFVLPNRDPDSGRQKYQYSFEAKR